MPPVHPDCSNTVIHVHYSAASAPLQRVSTCLLKLSRHLALTTVCSQSCAHGATEQHFDTLRLLMKEVFASNSMQRPCVIVAAASITSVSERVSRLAASRGSRHL